MHSGKTLPAKERRKMPVVDRSCPICDNVTAEPLWQYRHLTSSQTTEWEFEIHNVICENCGFVFTSPCLDTKVLGEYYADSFLKFSQQTLDYNIDNRITVIKRYVACGARFIELGSNLRTRFHEELRDYFSEVLTMEPNQSSESDFQTLDQLNNLKVDCVAHYFVLEHVPDITGFLASCADRLGEGGIMICEVPLLDLYSTFISPLILFEHVNHFTKETLKAASEKAGFEMIYSSTEDCSRPFGFVSVFRKVDREVNPSVKEYDRNKVLFIKGLDRAKDFFSVLTQARKLIFDLSLEGRPVIVWAANETTKRLFADWEIPKLVTIIDSDPRKKDYFAEKNHAVLLPADARQEIAAAGHIILCTKLHSEAILNSINKDFGKQFSGDNIYIADTI